MSEIARRLLSGLLPRLRYLLKLFLPPRALTRGCGLTLAFQTNFLKSLATNLRALRKVEVETRVKYFGPEEAMENVVDYDDDEYTLRSSKRRRV